MHPDPRFRWDDVDAMRAFVAERSFAQICVVADGRPLLAHVPLALSVDGAPCFHVARANPITPFLDGASVAGSVVADDFYVSPDWYAAPADQVPTWNYRVAEIYGRVRRLDEAGLRDQLDRLAAAQEGRLAPKRPWTNDKVRAATMTAMLKGIVGFTIDDARFVGTAKFSQNRPTADRQAVIAALGTSPAAMAMEQA